MDYRTDLIIQYRKARFPNVDAAAKAAGMSRAQYYRVEAGQCQSLRTVGRVALAVGLPLSDLFSEKHLENLSHSY